MSELEAAGESITQWQPDLEKLAELKFEDLATALAEQPTSSYLGVAVYDCMIAEIIVRAAGNSKDPPLRIPMPRTS